MVLSIKCENSEEYNIPKPKVTSSNILFYSDQQSKTQIYSIHIYIQRKAANPYIGEAGTRECFAYLLEKMNSKEFCVDDRID